MATSSMRVHSPTTSTCSKSNMRSPINPTSRNGLRPIDRWSACRLIREAGSATKRERRPARRREPCSRCSIGQSGDRRRTDTRPNPSVGGRDPTLRRPNGSPGAIGGGNRSGSAFHGRVAFEADRWGCTGSADRVGRASRRPDSSCGALLSMGLARAERCDDRTAEVRSVRPSTAIES